MTVRSQSQAVCRRVGFERTMRGRCGRKFDAARHSAFWNTDHHKAVKVAESDIHGLFISGDRIRPRYSAHWDLGAVAHRLQIDLIDFMAAHRRHPKVTVIAGVEAVMRHFDGQYFHDFLQPRVDDIDAVAIANGNADIVAVGRCSALIRSSGQRDCVQDAAGCGVDRLYSVFGFDRGEEDAAIGRSADPVHMLAHFDVLHYVKGSEVDYRDVISQAVCDIEPVGRAGSEAEGSQHESGDEEMDSHEHDLYAFQR